MEIYMLRVCLATNGSDMVEIKARTCDNIPMALKNKNKKIFGVQFHPEAILTDNGIDIFRNFLEF